MNKNVTFLFIVKIFRAFNFCHVTPAMKIFNVEFSPNYGTVVWKYFVGKNFSWVMKSTKIYYTKKI